MASVACLFLLLSRSIAGQATPTSALATLPVARHSDLHGADELDEVLVERTSSRSPSHRHSSPHLQGTGLQQVLPTRNSPGAPLAPPVLQSHDLSMTMSPHNPAEAPAVPRIDLGSSSKRPYKADRRPPGSVKNNPDLKLKANRESRARTKARVLAGNHDPRAAMGRPRGDVRTMEEVRAARRESDKRRIERMTLEEKAEYRIRQSQQVRRSQERRKARLSGLPEPPLQKQGRYARNGELRQPVPADTRMEEASQHAFDGLDALRNTLSPWPSGTSAGPWPVLESLPRAAHHQLASGPSLPPLDLGLSPSAPVSSTSRQGNPPQHAEPSSAGAGEEERLRLTLAPPDEHDRLRLTLAPPRHD